jgi:hypothetical protein
VDDRIAPGECTPNGIGIADIRENLRAAQT